MAAWCYYYKCLLRFCLCARLAYATANLLPMVPMLHLCLCRAMPMVLVPMAVPMLVLTLTYILLNAYVYGACGARETYSACASCLC